MKKIDTNLSVRFFVLVLLVLLCFTAVLFGQRQPYSSSEFIRNATIQMDKDGTSPTFIKFQDGYQPTIFTFLNEYKKSFTAFSSADNELRLSQTFEDKIGEKHYRFDQYYKGIKVEEAQFILHERNGYVRAANGKLVHGLSINIDPRLAENTALNNAIRNVGAEKYMWESQSNEIFIKQEQKNSNATFYPHGQLILTCGKDEVLNKNFKLVYRFDVYAQKPLGRYFVDVDAQNGEIVNKIERIHHSDVSGSGASLYNGTVSMTVDEVTASTLYRLQEHTTRSAAIESYNMQNGTDYNLAVDFTASTADGAWDQTGVNVHWGAEATYDYYLNNHGRNSFDNSGGTIFSYAHFYTNYNNAFWDGARMTYGDGDGSVFTPWVAIDVVGHEITHGVTQHSANLRYLGESGALNESFSDIFGNAVEFSKEGIPGVGTGSWRVSEDVTTSGLGIRNMQNPNDFNDPDTYLGTYWVSTGMGDNGGVHTNSGVQNFWFYLLCEGGSGTNDHGNVYSVSAIGFTKAAAIAYRNLTVYLTPISNYYAARVGAINAAIDLYGAGSSEVQAVMDAWDAVGVYEPVAPSGILVWEGVLGGSDYSGAFINTFLTTAGFTTQYTNVFPPSLIGYDAVFLSFGNWFNQSTLFDDAMASVVRTYLEAGGKVYLEGGDALGYEQASNTTILNLFGLASASDGTPSNVINNLAGQTGTLTDGMVFLSSNQVSNTWIDLYSPNTGTIAFVESDYGNVAVQNTGAYGQKTFCFSYALSQLVDGASPSTRNDLLAQITNFLSTPVPSFVTLSAPNGNDIWKVGTQHKIKWNKYLVDNVRLEYSTDNGTSWTEIIASTPASTGEYEWTIPNTPSTQCKVKVSDVLSPATYDESDNTFTIRPLGPIAEQEPNNSAPEAMLTGIFDEIEGTINPDNDVDYFKFEGSAGDLVQINGEERNSSSLEGLIMLFDMNGNQLYSSNHFLGTSLKQRIVYQLPNSGIYYVRYSNWNNLGNYPNSAVKGNEQNDQLDRMMKVNEQSQIPNNPMALSGDYRLTIGYFTPSAPIADNAYYNAATYNSVRFYGNLYPNGLPTTVTFEFGLTTGYGSTVQPNPAVYDGLNEFGTSDVNAAGLQPNTTYHFRMKAENSAGTDYSDDRTFTTPLEPEGWVFQSSGLSNENISLLGVTFTDEMTGYAVGSNYILKTTNGGNNWTNQNNSHPYTLRDIKFLTSNIGVAVGSYGTIARTTDGGTSWNSQAGLITSNTLYSVSFGNANVGFAVGSNGTILKTTDAGLNWSLLSNSPTTITLRGVHFTNANNGTIVGNNGVIITTTDGGTNWILQTIPSGNSLYAVHFADLNNGWAMGNGDHAYFTSNGGTTWNSRSLGNWYNLYGVFFSDANNGTAVGSGGVILKTSNGGNIWTRTNSGTTTSLYGIYYNVKGTIVGSYSTILRSVDFLTLNSPNGGEIWKVGSNYDIKWNTSGVDNVDLAYSTDNGSTWNPIATNQPASNGKYTWTIPNTISSQCKVKITKTGNGVGDESNSVFEIKAAGVTTEAEPNNTAPEAMNVGVIDEIEGTISPENDIDYFKFTAMAGDIVEINGEERNSSGLYGLIMLFDQSGSQLASNTYFNNTPTKQRIVYQLPSSGVYYVRYSNQNNWGNYPNIAAKSNDRDTEAERMLKPNQPMQKASAPLAYSGDYRLTIGYFTPSAPILVYTYTTDLNYNSARIGGQIYPNGSATTITINWGLTTAYDHNLVVTTDANGFNEYYFTSDKISGLNPSIPYHYQVVLQNSFGTTTGDDRVFSTPSAPVNWLHQNGNTTNSLRGIDFIDQNNGFIAGYNKSILKTTDGGTTWTNVCPQNIWFDGNCIDVVNTNKIASAGNSLMISEDGGSTWSQQQVGNYWINGISFTDINNGVLVNQNGEIYKTIDGGINWTLLTDPISTSLLTVVMLDVNTIFAVSSDGQVIKSSDGGLNWVIQILGNWSSSWWAGISFADVNNGMITSMNTFLMYKTTDGGTTWTTLNLQNNFPVVTMIDANNSLAAGFSVIRTQNGGATWTEEQTGSANLLFGIKAISYGEVWAVGEWGTILHFVPSHHFAPVWTDNPYTPMNIFVTSAQLEGVDLGADDEIGVFDGDNCVGFVKLTQTIPPGGYVQIIASTDDPTTPAVDGFIAGHTIAYKYWDNTNSREITRVIPTYAAGDGTFNPLGSATVSLNGILTINQNVELTTGWNIFSLTATPDNPNMLQLLNPLISGGVLIKTQNEQGNSVEQLPVIGWINNIGNWLGTEGYYMKVNAPSTLTVIGPPVSLPINIPLTTGWNIMGYPLQAERNALTVLDPLIAANQLIKVQDETGNSVEQLPIIGWINNIGNFKMDEGYSIKVNTNTSLTLDEPVPPINILAKMKEKDKQKTNIMNKPTANHFTPIWSNNPVFPMNIFVYSASLQAGGNLGAGDEIGVFDGSNCVGVVVLTGPISPYVQIIASADDQTTPAIDGFISGHSISYKFWLVSTSTEVSEYTVSYLVGNGTFAPQGTAAVNFTGILPVELTSFTANVNNNKVNLNWETATEVNNYGFEVERASSSATPLQGWKKLGFVHGNGNSNSPKSYSFADNNLVGGTKFQYRLKQIDSDGKYTYSEVVEVEVIPTEYALYQNYPNPFNPTTLIRYSLPMQSKVLLKVYDLIGNEIVTLINEEQPAGNYEVEFNTTSVSTGIASGVYLYRLQAGDFISTKKLVILK